MHYTVQVVRLALPPSGIHSGCANRTTPQFNSHQPLTSPASNARHLSPKYISYHACWFSVHGLCIAYHSACVKGIFECVALRGC
jgi:hypothetical protein